MTTITSEPLNPLEEFLRDYMATAGGLWEQVEPQVYDLLLPDSLGTTDGTDTTTGRVVRTVFDPEAVPEHPGAPFMTFGTPLLDAMLADAQRSGRYCRAYLTGLNLRPYNLVKQLLRSLDLPDHAGFKLTNARPLHFTVVVFWFSATYVSDHKEQDIFQVAIDLYYGRQVRHLDRLLDRGRLHDEPIQFLPDVPQKTLTEAYRLARDRVVRSISAAANLRRRELMDRCRRQEGRMIQYYRDMLADIDEQIARAASRSQDPARGLARRQAVQREEKLRLSELRKKNSLRVYLHLMNVLEVRQPKLLIEAELVAAEGHRALPALVWDPLIEALEAPTCPVCSRPAFSLRFHRFRRAWVCKDCAAGMTKT